MFARINHELAEREALEQQRQGLLKKKQGLIADNKKRKDDLASLDRELEGFIDVSFLYFLCFGGFFRIGEEWANDVWARRRNRYKRSLRSSTEEW